MNPPFSVRSLFSAIAVVFTVYSTIAELSAQALPGTIENASGLRLLVAPEYSEPVLRVILPGRPESDRAIEVIFPEHVTVRRTGLIESEQLYLFTGRSAVGNERPVWRRDGQSLLYERRLPGGIGLVARATLDRDGVRFTYEFRNQSDVAFDMIYAVNDPRLTSVFHDTRLERTYVHHDDGFDLLASETPERLSLAMEEWLPARYRASFTWPVPDQQVERPGDGIS